MQQSRIFCMYIDATARRWNAPSVFICKQVSLTCFPSQRTNETSNLWQPQIHFNDPNYTSCLVSSWKMCNHVIMSLHKNKFEISHEVLFPDLSFAIAECYGFFIETQNTQHKSPQKNTKYCENILNGKCGDGERYEKAANYSHDVKNFLSGTKWFRWFAVVWECAQELICWSHYLWNSNCVL